MTCYGYIRVSTKKQGSKYGLDRQEKILLENGVSKDLIISDMISGAKRSRNGLDHLLSIVESGDTIKVVSLDRLGRNLVDIITTIEDLRAKNVSIHFIHEGIDTSRNDPMSNAFISIAGAMAQCERELMLCRQEEAYAAMKAQGKQIGRPRVDQDKLNAAVDMYLDGKGSYRKIADIVGINPTTICQAVKDRTKLYPMPS